MTQTLPLKEGDPAPEFCLPDQDERTHCLKDYRGKWVVLYFYPKDNTPGCTLEAIEFTALKEEFEKHNAVVFGVSADSVQSHRKFCERHGLQITLLSDPEHRVLEAYGVWQLKKRAGKEYYGTVRSTYLIDPEGRVARIWFNVKAQEHAEKVLEELKTLRKGG